ncbi:MAG TPA: ribose-5-phosphate isomerase RpiA [Chloroflexia bacterium]|nr:ribose-5-phosphate isomerase RpiA [Chloroflexia bacterium]
MSEAQQPMTQQQLKQAAAVYAADTFVHSGMYLGLGSGSTSELFVKEVGRRVAAGQLENLITVSTSEKVAELARTFGLNVIGLDDVAHLDVTIDGADEIDPLTFSVVKGGGGALLREKLVAVASKLEVIIADESKLVTRLGEKMPIPVEVIPFGWHHTAARLRALNCDPILRLQNEKPYLTDSGNYILDCQFAPTSDPAGLSLSIKNLTGVVEHGIFSGIAGRVVIAAPSGVYEVQPPALR